MKIRNSVKAFIIENSRLLTIKGIDPIGNYYLLPGGGQRPGETMHQTLQRECLEEINCNVKVEDLIFVREYIGRNHEFAEYDKDTHQIEYIFLCKLSSNCTPKIGKVPDNNQVDIEWLELKKLTNYRLYPQEMRKTFSEFHKWKHKIYYGDIN
ncbi:NUDIX domain-containing protein [candidate division WOR-3 bacterium]|nr:NUDIX domain-containing protein [candidate division WOR-3 bacterium]